MTRSSIAAFSAFVLLAAGQAFAAADTPPTPPMPPAPSAAATPPPTSRLDPNQVICRREDVTGSRLGASKICHTRQEWDARSAASRDATDTLEQRRNLVR